MFESEGSPVRQFEAKRIDGMSLALRAVGAGLDAAGLLDTLRALEGLKSACAAAQALATDEFDRTRRTERAEKGIPTAQQGQGIAAEVGLARSESPNQGSRHLGLAIALVREMPHTFALLQQGSLSEWRATILVRETSCLSREDRARIDEELCSNPATLAGCGDRMIAAKAMTAAARLDAAALVRRNRKAVGDRRVSSRPAPDTMAYVTALLPVRQGVAVHATLGRDADSILATGDAEGRTRAQIMADLFVSRITGVTTAAEQPITVNLVISDEVLFGSGSTPAHVQGYGDIPAGLARQWVAEAADSGATDTAAADAAAETGADTDNADITDEADDTATKDNAAADTVDAEAVDTDAEANRAAAVLQLRRVYAHPATGALTAMESKSRCFPVGLRRFIDVRDRTCRTPWCDAPIRARDHIKRHTEGGATTTDNGAGLCAACNYAKEGDGWAAQPQPKTRAQLHRYEVKTPSGHRYRSTAPPLPRPAPLVGVEIYRQTELILVDLLASA